MLKARGREYVLPGTLLAWVLLAWCPCAFALNPSLDVSQYGHTLWKIRDGFTKGAVIAIAQTPDGYLWLGTEFGLFRFDGVRNVPFQPPEGQQLPSTQIFSLLVSRDGTLWIGTLKGLASWKDGKLTQYAELDGHGIFKILEDHEGSVWASGLTITVGKLCEFKDGGARCYGEDGALGRGAFNLYEDSKGNLWAGVKDGLWRWRPGPPKFYPLAGEPDGIQGLGEDDDGVLLVGWQGGIHRFVEGKTEAYPLPATVGQFRARRLLRDRDGGLWVGTTRRGLVHLHRGRTDLFTTSDGLSAEDIYNIFEDREGNVWVATINGLDRFREFSVATLTMKQGLSNDLVFSVLADRDGSVWLANRGGLNRWNDGQVTVYRGRAAPPKTGVREVVGSGVPDEGLASLFQDDRGRIWISTLRGVGYMENERFAPVSGLSDGIVTYIVQDGAGTMWFAEERRGLYQLPRGGEVRHIPWAALGHEDPASALAGDPSRGGLWLGFNHGGVEYFVDDQVRASYAAADGLAGERVNHLRLDPEGVLWVAADGGLSRLKDGRVATLAGKNGLPCDTVHWSMEDDARTLWLYTACGLVRVARPELDAWAASVDRAEEAKQAIRATVFDSSDGVRILAGGGHYSPQVAKSSDGRLWFLPFDGASVLDPNRLPFNRLPPPVRVEQIIADRKTYEVTPETGGRVRLPPLIRDMEIDYTALSLAAPEKILFRYKLEGRDADWQEAGNRRQAFYNDLPPGDYRFRVMACNNSGVWNEAGTFMDFNIAPAYYQTTWFRVLSVAVFLLLLGALYRLRLRQVARQVRGRMEERHAERERIARDLHDTLLQSVQGLILKFHAVATKMRVDDPAYVAIEKTLDQADAVLAEGRDRIRNLRGTTAASGGLPAAFRRVVEETPQGGGVAFKTVVEGSVRELHPIIREESYCIGREALVNALTHSEGRNVEVEITYDPRQFRLRVRDDGRGIDPAVIEDGLPDHWGLRGMRERAQRIGAQLNLWSRPETGTEVELTVPGATAYQVPGVRPNRFWSRRSNGAD